MNTNPPTIESSLESIFNRSLGWILELIGYVLNRPLFHNMLVLGLILIGFSLILRPLGFKNISLKKIFFLPFLPLKLIVKGILQLLEGRSTPSEKEQFEKWKRSQSS